MDCIFCKIAHGEIPSNTIYKDGKIRIFHDINPQAPTHWLAIPTKHITSVVDVAKEDTELLGYMFLKISELAKTHKLDDYRIVVNTGENAGQSVFHLHYHFLSGRNFSWPPG